MIVSCIGLFFGGSHISKLVHLYVEALHAQNVTAVVKSKILSEKSEAFKTAYVLNFNITNLNQLYNGKIFYSLNDKLNTGDSVAIIHCSQIKYSTFSGFSNRYASSLFYAVIFLILGSAFG
ncbi:MAG TPA: hypothetical protein PLO59_03380, partial [Bacteroidia bacterium]|nr:hypothetical protein [Bacteroidia bacterium]